MSNIKQSFLQNRFLMAWLVISVGVIAVLDKVDPLMNYIRPTFQDVLLEVEIEDGEVIVNYEITMARPQHAIWRTLFFVDGVNVESRYGYGNYSPERNGVTQRFTWDYFTTGVSALADLNISDAERTPIEIPVDREFHICVEYLYDTAFAIKQISERFCSATHEGEV